VPIDPRHELALGPRLLDTLGLVLGQHLGEEALDRDLPRDGLGRPEVVSGHHHRLDALATEPG
jgi:hypothetical protein